MTCYVDHAPDTGFGVGAYGGEAAVKGMFEETEVNVDSSIG